jgi:hypothetical protein
VAVGVAERGVAVATGAAVATGVAVFTAGDAVSAGRRVVPQAASTARLSAASCRLGTRRTRTAVGAGGRVVGLIFMVVSWLG